MKVLIVDDDREVSTFLKKASELKLGTEVDVAYSGEEAVAMTIQGDYDLITLDIKMPGVGGLDIIGLLRSLRPHTIIAIISGHLPDNISPDVSLCADVIMSKPIALRTFQKLLDCSLLMSNTLKEIQQMGHKSTVETKV